LQARARRRPCGLATPRIVSKSDLQNAFPGKLIRNKYIAVRLGDVHQLKERCGTSYPAFWIDQQFMD
jgi:hypothetical protein